MTPLFAVAAILAVALTGCGERHDPAPAEYVPLADVRVLYGTLITAGNHPTPYQHGTGERIGLFQDARGTVWGLPLAAGASGAILVCAPPAMHDEKVTDTFPDGWTVIGSTNEPTGWRGGNGDLELLLRDARGAIRWQAVRGARITGGRACWSPRFPGPLQQLHYYRLAPASGPTR